MLEYAKSRQIKMITSTLYYAQANGQVKAVNKSIITLIKRNVDQCPRNWHNLLSQVLWAYWNSPRDSKGTTPIKLVYRHNVVLPIEVNLQNIQIAKQEDLHVKDYWNELFDELNKLEEERLSALERLIRQKESIAQSYNCRVKLKLFNVGDLVWKVILPIDKKSRTLGKWSPNWEGPFKIEKVFSGNTYALVDVKNGLKIALINGKYLKSYKPVIYEINIR